MREVPFFPCYVAWSGHWPVRDSALELEKTCEVRMKTQGEIEAAGAHGGFLACAAVWPRFAIPFLTPF